MCVSYLKYKQSMGKNRLDDTIRLIEGQSVKVVTDNEEGQY